MFKFAEAAVFRIARDLIRRSLQQFVPAGAVFRDLLQDQGYIHIQAAFRKVAAVNFIIETSDQMGFPAEFVHCIEFMKYGIAFIHAADRSAQRIAWKSLLEVGRYVVTYEDGSEVVIPIEYGGNIRSMYERHAEPLKPAYYRHEGYIATYLADPISSKNEDGGDVTLYRYQWKNPAPQKKIVGIKLEGSGETDVRVLLYGIEGLYNDR